MNYLIHGVSVEVVAAWPELGAAIDGRLRPFRASGRGRDRFRLEYVAVPTADAHVVPRPPPEARLVYEGSFGQARWVDADDSLWLTADDRVRLRAEFDRGTLLASVVEPGPAENWLASHPLLTVPLMELLKRRSRFALHAAGACCRGRAVLIVGGSGAGKSTLAVVMLVAGFGLLSDDTVFLETSPDGTVGVLAFPDEIDLCDDTIALFPDLAHLLDQARPPGWLKRPYRPASAWFDPSFPALRPAVLVFPQVARTSSSRFEPMTEHESLLELAPNVLLTNFAAAKAHLDILGALARQCPAFRLFTGNDLDRLADQLSGLADAAD